MIRFLLSASLLAVIAGCNSSSGGDSDVLVGADTSLSQDTTGEVTGPDTVSPVDTAQDDTEIVVPMDAAMDQELPDDSGGGLDGQAVDSAPDAAIQEDAAPDTAEDTASNHDNVSGTVTLVSGDCMPPAPPECAVEEVLTDGDLYFIDMETEASFKAEWSDGVWHVDLPDGKYFIWPDIGWAVGAVEPACWADLSQCSEEDYAFIKGDFEYMENKPACAGFWQSHDRCNLVISGAPAELHIEINNVAW